MTQLQKIVAKAKTLKKSHPNTKWTDLIKKASKLIPASKSVGAIKKKKTVKKAVKKYAPVKPLVKKKKAVKKSPARSMHKDTKSHNVRISVVSGIDMQKHYQDLDKLYDRLDSTKEYLKQIPKQNYRTKAEKNLDRKLTKQRIDFLNEQIKLVRQIIINITKQSK